ncbi:fibrobacter succinogenes major paralogous domain-containing protein [Flavobacterium caeni]|uniref:Major paralogous domain-containing protein n=1 Tax=Flavobacterium caeni TaxID=490189 RepID=A0A1G5KC10_9FLAO|nr:fibrobacter succinogenes major paralogous domain-containing protein [Flavobacterium caeni]SCY98077.1 major paralogous domain-containing protein [Flavobacterium caeni]
MKNLLLTVAIFSILHSCSNDEYTSQKNSNSATDRPSVPITNSEVNIGNQIWMTKNLGVSRYRNGDLIPQIQNTSQWWNTTSGAWCYYENITANGVIYGKLYNWYAVNDPRGLAPEGWHIPTEIEFANLRDYLGGPNVAGGAMKSLSLWNLPNIGATNSSGFSALAGGYRKDSSFSDKGTATSWWTETEIAPFDDRAYNFYVERYSPQCIVEYSDKNIGFAVRCVKD